MLGKLLLLIALLFLAFRNWKKRPKAGEQAEIPKWMTTIDGSAAVASLILGVLLSGVNPKNLLLNVAAAGTIAAAALTTTVTALVIIVFILISSITIIGPVLYVQIAGERADHGLDDLNVWLLQHNAAIMRCCCSSGRPS